MERSTLTASMAVAEVMTRWPQTVSIFLNYRMACVGCTMSPFDNLADVSEIYGLDLDRLLDELQHAITLDRKD